MTKPNYLLIGLAVVAGVLLIGAVVIYFTTGNTVAAGGTGTAAAAVAAEALRRRQAALATVDAAKKDTQDTGNTIKENAGAAETGMAAVPGQVEAMTDGQKVDEGNAAFGGTTSTEKP